MSRDRGGPPPAGNASKPVHDCPACGTQYTGGSHRCREASRINWPAPGEKHSRNETELELEAG
jgi:hypothetical protein